LGRDSLFFKLSVELSELLIMYRRDLTWLSLDVN